MKNRIKISIMCFLVISFIGCKQNDGMVYDGDSYINFVKEFGVDSALCSFAFDSKLDVVDVAIEVEIASIITSNDRTYKVKIVESESTAKEGVHFDKLPEMLLFGGDKNRDFLNIKVKKSADLDNGDLFAVFEIIDGGDFKPGIFKNRKAKLYITNKISRPTWWDRWHETSGLGVYSDKKYKLFIDHSGEHDLDYEKRDDMDYSQMRALVLRFRNYVLENNIMEDNGNPMVIPIKG